MTHSRIRTSPGPDLGPNHTRPARRWRRHIQAVAGLAAAALTLAACSALPQNGPVTAAQPRLNEDTPLVQQALGPVPGSTPQRLVQDFLRACAAGSYDEYQVARQYLTAAAAATWRPEQLTYVVEPGQSVAANVVEAAGMSAKQVQVNLTGPVIGFVRANGIYEQAAQQLGASLTLEQNAAGQWRIATLADHTIIPSTAFNTGFIRRNVYFVSSDGSNLIADPRYFTRRRLATHLVVALLGGPSPALAGTVQSAFAVGTSLTSSTVDIQDSTATVDLSAQVADVSPQLQTLMLWQLERTLTGVNGITKVTLAAAGKPVVVENKRTMTEPRVDVLAGFSDKGVVWSSTSSRPVIIQPAAQVLSLHLEEVALGPGINSPVVGLGHIENDGDGVIYLLANGATPVTTPTVLYRGQFLTPPSVDLHGWVWTSHDGGERPIVAARDQDETDSLGITVNGTILQVAVSLDGARIAVLSGDERRSMVSVGAITRAEDGRPTGIRNVTEIANLDRGYRELAWVDNTSLATLRPEDGKVNLLRISGPSESYDAPPGSVGLICGGPEALLGVVDEKTNRYFLTGTFWRRAGDGLSLPTYAG